MLLAFGRGIYLGIRFRFVKLEDLVDRWMDLGWAGVGRVRVGVQKIDSLDKGGGRRGVVGHVVAVLDPRRELPLSDDALLQLALPVTMGSSMASALGILTTASTACACTGTISPNHRIIRSQWPRSTVTGRRVDATTAYGRWNVVRLPSPREVEGVGPRWNVGRIEDFAFRRLGIWHRGIWLVLASLVLIMLLCRKGDAAFVFGGFAICFGEIRRLIKGENGAPTSLRGLALGFGCLKMDSRSQTILT